MQRYGAVVASFYAPAAAVAFFVVDHYDSCFFGLFQGVSWTRDYTWGWAAKPTSDGYVDQWMQPHGAYPGFLGAEGFFFGEGAYVLAHGAA
jgi:hypothetical protein